MILFTNKFTLEGSFLDDKLVRKECVFKVNGFEEFDKVRRDPSAFLKANLAILPPDLAMKLASGEGEMS